MCGCEKVKKKSTHVIVDDVGMHVVNAVIHDGRGDVLAGDSLSPSCGNVQVQLGFATILTRIFLIMK